MVTTLSTDSLIPELKSQLVVIDTSLLVKAEWNYKTNGTPEQNQKLAESIKHDGSAGVIVVRELKGGKYEVLDGNHRVDALKLAQWKHVLCENFGQIELADAVLIARRRNHQWYEDDLLKYAKLYRDVVLPNYPVDDLVTFMPDSKTQLEELTRILDFNWDSLSKGAEKNGEQLRTLTLRLTDEMFEMWARWCARFRGSTNNDDPSQAFSALLTEATEKIKGHVE